MGGMGHVRWGHRGAEHTQRRQRVPAAWHPAITRTGVPLPPLHAPVGHSRQSCVPFRPASPSSSSRCSALVPPTMPLLRAPRPYCVRACVCAWGGGRAGGRARGGRAQRGAPHGMPLGACACRGALLLCRGCVCARACCVGHSGPPRPHRRHTAPIPPAHRGCCGCRRRRHLRVRAQAQVVVQAEQLEALEVGGQVSVLEPVRGGQRGGWVGRGGGWGIWRPRAHDGRGVRASRVGLRGGPGSRSAAPCGGCVAAGQGRRARCPCLKVGLVDEGLGRGGGARVRCALECMRAAPSCALVMSWHVPRGPPHLHGRVQRQDGPLHAQQVGAPQAGQRAAQGRVPWWCSGSRASCGAGQAHLL